MKFVRIYSGKDGQSHFEDLEATRAATLFGKSQPATSIIFKDKSDLPSQTREWHPAPRRQYCITLAGSADIAVGDGTVKTFEPGDVFLADDLTGQGHTLAPRGWVRVFIPIP